MKKSKIIAIILSGAITVSLVSGMTIHKTNKINQANKNIKNNVLFSNRDQVISKNACVINGDNNLVLTNQEGKVISYISVGEMLKVQSTNGTRSFVTVQETGVKGYISNKNILGISSGNINNITRMNRLGSIINVSNTVNVRKGPSINDEILDGLINNAAVRIIGKTGQWYRVSVNGIKGFIFEEYIAQKSNSNIDNTLTVHRLVDDSTSTSHYISATKGDNYTPAPIVNGGSSENHNTNTNHKDTNTSSDKKGDVVNTNVQITGPDTHGPIVTPDIKPDVKPQPKPVVVVPKLKAHNVRLKVGTPFNTSMILATASQGATISYQGADAINTTKPTDGTPYKVIVSATKNGVSTKIVVNVSVVDEAPQLTASRQTTLTVGTPFNISLLNTRATSSMGRNLTNDIKVISGDTSTTKAHGFENITLAVKDQFGTETTLTVQLKVVPKEQTNPTQKPITPLKPSIARNKGETLILPAPVISGHNVTVKQGVPFNIGMLDVSARVNSKPVQVIFSNDTVNIYNPGTYEIIATATNSQGEKTSKVFTVKVEPIQGIFSPVIITGENIIIKHGSSFNVGMLNAHATVAGTPVIINYLGSVNTNKEGTYYITAEADNFAGKVTKKIFTVTVKKEITQGQIIIFNQLENGQPVTNRIVKEGKIGTEINFNILAEPKIPGYTVVGLLVNGIPIAPTKQGLYEVPSLKYIAATQRINWFFEKS